jgi:ABC-type transporter Mla subunit MlaD
VRGGAGSGIASNPVLIGAATLLVTIVAMFLSYNANNGLPFVPTYALTLESESATNVNKGNEVRIGGARVGVVADIQLRRLENGENRALLKLKLDKIVEPLPKDSTFSLRPKSLLGLKYVDIVRGKSKEGFEEGDAVPASANQPEQVELDELADTFDEQTRRNQQINLEEFGNGLAGRGASINQAIGEFRPLLRDVVPVMRFLSNPDTGLSRLVRELGDAASIVAPVAEQQASLFVNLDRTFTALREVARPYIQESIEEGPATLDTAIRSFAVQRPFLANTEGLMRELAPGVRSLRRAVPDLSRALQVGTPTLRRSVALSERTEKLLTTLQGFAEDPVVPQGVRGLTDAVTELRPTLEFIAPTQTQCNYVAHWFRNVSSLLSEGDASGTWQRFIIIATPQGVNNEGGPSSAPANGDPANATQDNYLHSNPYPHTAAPGEPKECEAANEPFAAGRQVIGNVEGTQPAQTQGTP